MEKSRYIYSNSKSLSNFLKSILKFRRPSPNSYHCFNNKGINHVTRLRLGLSHLRDHKFKHGFLDSLTYSSADSWKPPIHVSDWLIFCCGNLIQTQNDKNTNFMMKNKKKMPKSM